MFVCCLHFFPLKYQLCIRLSPSFPSYLWPTATRHLDFLKDFNEMVINDLKKTAGCCQFHHMLLKEELIPSNSVWILFRGGLNHIQYFCPLLAFAAVTHWSCLRQLLLQLVNKQGFKRADCFRMWWSPPTLYIMHPSYRWSAWPRVVPSLQISLFTGEAGAEAWRIIRIFLYSYWWAALGLELFSKEVFFLALTCNILPICPIRQWPSY